jgi:hypothetical protein
METFPDSSTMRRWCICGVLMSALAGCAGSGHEGEICERDKGIADLDDARVIAVLSGLKDPYEEFIDYAKDPSHLDTKDLLEWEVWISRTIGQFAYGDLLISRGEKHGLKLMADLYREVDAQWMQTPTLDAAKARSGMAGYLLKVTGEGFPNAAAFDTWLEANYERIVLEGRGKEGVSVRIKAVEGE